MGDQVYPLVYGEEIPVEVTGSAFEVGWQPGTFVTYSSSAPLFHPKVLAVVEKSNGIGIVAGFLFTGPQNNPQMETLSNMWNTDTLRREGGDVKANFGAFDNTMAFEFDSSKQLQRVGSRLATLNITPSGMHKFYMYEILNYAARHGGGGGASLVYAPNDLIYVSDNGLATNEKEQLNSVWTGYVVARTGNDEEGDFLILTAAMM